MSLLSNITKIAIKLTPNKLIKWVANIVLKDIAELTGFNFDIEQRKIYVQIQLVGESETIDVWIEDFAIIADEGNYRLLIQEARSNRIWLGNILSRIIKKEWKIPVTPQMSAQIDFLAELLPANKLAQEEN